MAKIITVSNPKGGVGKTTTSINLGASLAICEKKVLLIDIDPDGAVGTGLGFSRDKIKAGVYELYSGKVDLGETIHTTMLPGLHVVPCNVWTGDQETRLAEWAKDRFYLKRQINRFLANHSEYDFVIIDSPPALSDLTISALLASHSVLIPLQCGHFALKAVGRLMRVIREIRHTANSHLRIEGILLNFYEKGTKVSSRVLQEANLVFKNLIFKTIIPKNSALGYAAFAAKPAAMVNVSGSGAKAYLALAVEILQKDV